MTESHKDEWLKSWQKADYSWDGLAKKPLDGWCIDQNGELAPTRQSAVSSRPATLQDYWRTQEDNLFECDGKMWTCIHLPPHSASRTKIEKHHLADEIWKAIQGKLNITKKTLGLFGDESIDGRIWHPASTDFRLQLQGAILILPDGVRYANLGNWNLNAKQTYFIGSHNFSGCIFENGTDFSETLFDQDANFFSSVFTGDLSFYRAAFCKGANFWRSQFQGEASFECAHFLGERTSFWVAEFEGEARFLGAYFESKAWFRYTIFKKKAYFSQYKDAANGALFADEAIFDNATFNDLVSFQKTKFNSKLSFEGVTFCKSAEFTNCDLPKREICWRGAFHGALMMGLFDIRGDTYHAISMYDNARFEGQVLYPKLNDLDSISNFKEKSLGAACSYTDEQREIALHSLEGGAHALKFVFSNNNNKRDEHMFYQYEMLTRRYMERTSRSEKMVSALYCHFSSYGNAILRPFTYLIIVSISFALCFYSIGAGTAVFLTQKCIHEVSALKGALQLSLYNSFRPFWFWGIDTAQGVAPVWLTNVMPDISLSIIQWLAVGILSTIQSLISVMCIFLFGYCLKRRFQIK